MPIIWGLSIQILKQPKVIAAFIVVDPDGDFSMLDFSEDFY